MNFEIPQLKCTISIESFAPNGSVACKRSLTDACLRLCRNQQSECVLSILDKSGKEAKRFTFAKNQENYRLNTKFAKEGKASLALPDVNLRIFISNCPPNDLSLFLKGFSLKCNYSTAKESSKNENAFSMMARSVSNIRVSQKETIEKISPLTSKDLYRNMAFRDQTNSKSGLTSSISSPVSSKRNFQKRKLENSKLFCL